MTTIHIDPQCLICDTPFATIPDCEKGEIIECPACGQEHEVIDAGDTGMQVALAPEVEEDWGE